jgi:hypothetical protein
VFEELLQDVYGDLDAVKQVVKLPLIFPPQKKVAVHITVLAVFM